MLLLFVVVVRCSFYVVIVSRCLCCVLPAVCCRVFVRLFAIAFRFMLFGVRCCLFIVVGCRLLFVGVVGFVVVVKCVVCCLVSVFVFVC